MPDQPTSQNSPSAFVGNFRGYIASIQAELEAEYGDDAGGFESVAQRAETDAQFVAARNWLVERWGERFPCPVCQNIEWTLSEVSPAVQPTGYFSFSITCGYCGNTMQVVPGNAPMDAPRSHDEQLHFPAPE